MVALSQHRIPGYRDRLKRRGDAAEAATEQLHSNVRAVEDCITEVESIAKRLVAEVREWEESNVKGLMETKQRLQTDINAIVTEAERVFFEDSPIGIRPATKAFREFVPGQGNFTLFAYSITPCSLTQLLSEVLAITQGLNFEFDFDCSTLTSEAKQKEAEKGPFVYRADLESATLMSPVRLSDGSVYIGEWKGGKRIGKGKLFRSDGGLQEGYWDGELQQEGRLVYPNGDFYEGEFHQGVFQGSGRFEDYSGRNAYSGMWCDGKRHGYGVEHMHDGSEYDGLFANNEKSGQGVLKWPNGEVYSGEFKNNRFHGRGKYLWRDRVWYDGDWVEGSRQGKGRFHTEDNEYEGDYFKDKKHGHGVYMYDGKVYDGGFWKNKMHGKGYLTLEGKERKLYRFINNKRVEEITE